jgi:hypothetical protein
VVPFIEMSSGFDLEAQKQGTAVNRQRSPAKSAIKEADEVALPVIS